MKKHYTKPNMLCEEIDPYVIITMAISGEAEGDKPVLAPKRRSIWDDED